MKITELLADESILLDLKAEKKEDVWEALANSLKEIGAVHDVSKYLEDVQAREMKGTTGVGFGVAIPHAKSEGVTRPALAMARLENKVDVHSLDGTQADLFFLIAAPIQGEDIHLRALSKLARLLIHASFLESLRTAKTPEEVKAVIEAQES
ncbi:PTS system D-fructose-specific IIA component (F1P-forming), Frc family [Desulfosporosinus acidiphilus SJ4]|uniref:PTS system D-fructose-specific IIA component (F1P-forming), Frc family n=1 Tax=Desulfosporosinus acidiphilus (strain DSM 22704 / JCM 16185 / SJ4) TaxID=646529 RepID=I4DB38_DESAJ|nr:PTS sugar transporter subunit IIA [Desulfosporosinus acidiphilus]AFM43012.1 PTS system D-fructose-specific IIA component (F1P-forming), Frc family [Desulfosporosinus acidiphilus SJ4]